MAAREIAAPEGTVVLDNPEIGDGISLGRDYTLEEVAEIHARTIASLASADPLTVCGMSMGGMIVAILATELRGKLPSRCLFRFLVTTPNKPENPAIPDATVTAWTSARRGNRDDFERVLSPFFAPSFRRDNPDLARKYYEDDEVLGPNHNRDLRDLCPGAEHEEVQGLGHMINIESPERVRKALLS